MKLFLYNFTMTPNIVKKVVITQQEVIVKEQKITEAGIYTPPIGLLKVGMTYPSPNGNRPIQSIGDGYIIV